MFERFVKTETNLKKVKGRRRLFLCPLFNIIVYCFCFLVICYKNLLILHKLCDNLSLKKSIDLLRKLSYNYSIYLLVKSVKFSVCEEIEYGTC